MKMKKIISLTLLTITLVICVGCYTVPEIGRSSFIAISMDEEKAMGAEAYTEAKKQFPISQNQALQNKVKSIGNNIAAISAYPDWEWEFTVLEAPDTPNAWCLPGGKVAVYTGLMPLLKSDAELATVIAHEIGHAVARHGAERMSRQMMVATGAEIAGVAVGEQYAETAKIAYGVGSEVFVMLPYSRKQEYEADKIGVTYMARAGYDPRESINLWNRFKEMLGQNAPPEFLSTHPADENRIEQLNELMPAALEEYEKSDKK